MKLIRKNIPYIFTCLLFLLILQTSALGYDKGGHSRDWNAVMGLSLNSCMSPCWEKFQNVIDTKSFEMMSFMKTEYNLRHQKCCGHRTYFHWGFHAKPFQIRKTLEKCIKNWHEVENNSQEEIVEILIDEQSESNNAMYKAIRRYTKLHKIGRRRYRAIAPILYDVHLLSDYQTKDTEPLSDLGYLKKEINQEIARLFKGTSEGSNFKDIQKKLNNAYLSSHQNSKKAENMLIVLRTSFAVSLWQAFEKDFPSNLKRCKNQNMNNPAETGRISLKN